MVEALPNVPPRSEAACGFVAVLGAPNTGKSTLVNALVGAKVSIVSPKVQTTRTRILGIVIEGKAQIVFVDTPGVFLPRKRLDRAMVAAAWQGAADADAIALLVDSRRELDATSDDTRRILGHLTAERRRAVLVLNKVDLVRPPQLLGVADRFDRMGLFGAVFMISALNGDGVADLRRHFAQAMSPGPWMFPPDQLSDMPDRMLAAEITREQLFNQLQQELPYAVTVETESWQERKDGSVKIEQIVYVQREGQKAIVVGEGGGRVKSVGAAARKELERLLERRVHLFLRVKVRENWQDDPERYRAIGLDYQ